jgi:site-specific DNA recombinase
MKNEIGVFKLFAKQDAPGMIKNIQNGAVIYTRVSTKEAQEERLSLETQMDAIMSFCERQKLQIVEKFGGQFESAKTDGRKEFNRMLTFIKKNKRQIKCLLVYSIDRFSRTGAEAIVIKNELLNTYGVELVEIINPSEARSASGAFNQDIKLIFSHYDNQLRRMKCKEGIKTHLRKGIWCMSPPIGYSAKKEKGQERKLVINKDGEKLRKAFEWKAEGMSNDEILQRLNTLNMKGRIYKQKISQIFSNPFYCGIIVSVAIPGEAIEGQHQALISKELFLKVNDVRKKTGGKFGTQHQWENNNIPLKLFTKCATCKRPLTGYVVKKKNLYYYKCPTVNCRCNKNADRLNERFHNLLKALQITPQYVQPILYQLQAAIQEGSKDNENQRLELSKELKSIQQRVDNLEEKYYELNEMDKDTFERRYAKLLEQKEQTTQNLTTLAKLSSNLSDQVLIALTAATKLATVWASGDCSVRKRLQNLVFPEGIVYDHKNDEVLTTKVNSVFLQIAQLAMVSGQKETGQVEDISTLSSQVGKTGFEPATTWSQTRYATGLRYFPFINK